MKRQAGYIIFVYLFLLALVMLTAVVVVKIKSSSAVGVRDRKKLEAMQVAQAGINAGYQWLKEDPSRWAQVATTPVILSSGTFGAQLSADAQLSVTISNGTTSNQRKITAVAQMKSAANAPMEAQALEATLQIDVSPSALWSSKGVTSNGSATIHWGPMYASPSADGSPTNIVLTGAAAGVHFPRKLASGTITVAGALKTNDGLEYFPNQTDLPDMPTLDLAKYEDMAKNPGINGNNASNQYFDTSQNLPGIDDISRGNPNLPFDTAKDNIVRFFAGNLKLTGNSYIQGTVIVLGDLTFVGNGNGIYKTPIPSGAYQEYAKMDTGAADEYPGDMGSTINNWFKFGDPTAQLKNGSNAQPSVNGFIYVLGTLKGSGNTVIHGAVWVKNSAGITGNITIYYRDDLNIFTKNTPTFRITQIRPVPPS